jgi:RNA polymerase sigma-70 factor (ECF subfamily)
MMIDEAALIARLKEPRSREAAFREVLRAFQKPLYWHIRRMVHDHDDADDVLQETFIKAWKGIEGFREEAKLRTWMYRIATNESITHLNRKNKRSLSPVEDIEDDVRHSGDEAALPDGDVIRERLNLAVETLPDKQKLVFQLRYFEEMTYEEMVEVLGGTEGSLKASYHHAVKKIEKYFEAG